MSCLKKYQPGNPCGCTSAGCALNVTSTEPGLCDSDTDYGIWTSGYGISVPSPTVVITNSAGTTVGNGTTQPAGTYTATSSITGTHCASVTQDGGVTYENACITFGSPVSTGVTHTCPSDSTHSVVAPGLATWQCLTLFSAVAISGPFCSAGSVSGTGTVDGTGQTFSIPGTVLLASDGTDLTITGTFTLTGSISCGSPCTGLEYSVTGSFTVPYCYGPCHIETIQISCGEAAGTVAGIQYETYCSPDGGGDTGPPITLYPTTGGGTVSTSVPDGFRAKKPGLMQMALNFGGAVKDHVQDGMRKASPEAKEQRKETCFACPLLDKEQDRCLSCGCTMMDLKRSWASSRCPEGKWGAESSGEK